LHQLPPLGLILLALSLALPAASAEGAATRQAPFASSRSFGEPGASRPSAMFPMQGLHAQAFPIAALGVWAQGHGFALTRRASMYDIEGGAALRIHDGVRLTASYRVLGIDLGFDSDVEGADGGLGISAPFIGLAFDF
jgi:hypothetical protein